jgi:3-oxoacyl-[acyl-carrier-protein] synthase-1
MAMLHSDPMPWVVGVGACTSVGNDLAATAAAVRAGISGFAEHPWCVDTAGLPMTVARVGSVDPQLVGAPRFAALAVDAARQALADCSARMGRSVGVTVFLGLPRPRPGLRADLVPYLEDALQGGLEDLVRLDGIEVVRSGHASGLVGLDWARQRLASGAVAACLVGGVDSYLEADTLEWLEARGQLHSSGPDNNAWGFIPGEAAGWCVLLSATCAQDAGLAPWGRVRSAAVCREPTAGTDEVCLGTGLTEAFLTATGVLDRPAERVDHVLCDMNGEPQRAEEYGFASLRTHDRFSDAADFLAPADCWGDIGAASGPLLVGLACSGRAKRYLPGNRSLIWAASEDGERAAILLDFIGTRGVR